MGSHSEGSGIKDKQNRDESKTKSRLCNRAPDNFLGLEMVAVYLLVALNSGLDKMRKTMAKCCQELLTNGTITKRKGWSSCPWAINGLSNIFWPASWPSFQLIWPCLISLLVIVIELFSFFLWLINAIFLCSPGPSLLFPEAAASCPQRLLWPTSRVEVKLFERHLREPVKNVLADFAR